jgi:hypothetical protein
MIFLFLLPFTPIYLLNLTPLPPLQPVLSGKPEEFWLERGINLWKRG